MDHSTSWSLWDIPIPKVTLKTKVNAPPCCPWAFLSLHDLLHVMKMNLSVIVVFRDNMSLIVFHDNLFLLSFCDNPSIPSSVFHDNSSGVFCDNPFVSSSVFHDNRLVSFMTIRLFRLVSSVIIHLVSPVTIRLVSFVIIHLFRLVSSIKFVYYLPWQSFMSFSKDSLLLSYVAVHCLTLSFFVFFYSLWTLLKTIFCCPSWQSVVLPWALLCSFIMFHLLHGFFFFRRWLFFRHFYFVDPTSLRGFYFMQFQTQGFVILHLEFEGGC